MTKSSADPTQDVHGATHEAEDQHVTAGERPGDSIRELTHPDENVGVTDDVTEHGEEAKQQAAQLAEDIRGPEGHHPRERL